MKVEGMYSFYFIKKTEQAYFAKLATKAKSETTLRHSAVRCSGHLKFHTSAASGLKNGQFDRRRNFVVLNKGAFRRSNLILFVLVLGNQNFIEDDEEDEVCTL